MPTKCLVLAWWSYKDFLTDTHSTGEQTEARVAAAPRSQGAPALPPRKALPGPTPAPLQWGPRKSLLQSHHQTQKWAQMKHDLGFELVPMTLLTSESSPVAEKVAGPTDGSRASCHPHLS